MMSALERAFEAELTARRKRIKVLQPKLKELSEEYRALMAQLEELEDMQARWQELSDAAPGVQGRVTRVSVRENRSSGDVDKCCDDILACLQECGPLSPGDLREKLSLHKALLTEPLRRLRQREAVVVVGHTNSRRYALTGDPRITVEAVA